MGYIFTINHFVGFLWSIRFINVCIWVGSRVPNLLCLVYPLAYVFVGSNIVHMPFLQRALVMEGLPGERWA